MVHHVDLLENYFLFVLNYIVKVKIANCRVYKGGVITWNMAAASQENYFMQGFHWLTTFSRHHLGAENRAKMGGAFKDKHASL